MSQYYPMGFSGAAARSRNFVDSVTEPNWANISPVHARRGIYEPLDSSIQQIRLIRFLPSIDKLVRISLKVVSLESNLSYEALSYVWGDPTVTADVDINGSIMPVTINLEHALRHLRYEDCSSIIWADAICINQSDREEKEEQVAMMRNIYRHAYRVCAWLGEMPEGAAYALRRLFRQATSVDSREYSLTHPTKAQVRAHQQELHSMLDADETPDQFTDCLRPIAEATYWSRKWIPQELAFARAIRLYCGKQFVDIEQDIPRWQFWNNLNTFVSYTSIWGWLDRDQEIQESEQERYHVLDNRNRMDELEERRSKVYGDLGLSIENFMQATSCIAENPDTRSRMMFSIDPVIKGSRSLSATDARDCVFALQGYLPEQLRIPTNYSLTTSETFTKFTYQVARASESLIILDQACSSVDGLPSWVPDFRTERRHPLCPRPHHAPSAVSSAPCTRISYELLAVPAFEVDKLHKLVVVGTLTDLNPCSPRKAISFAYNSWNSIWKALSTDNGDLAESGQFWSTLNFTSDFYLQLQQRDYGVLTQALGAIIDGQEVPETSMKNVKALFEWFLESFMMCFTASGRIACALKGQALPNAGDRILIIASARSIFFARPLHHAKGTRPKFKLVSQGFVEGAMEGEIIRATAEKHSAKVGPINEIIEDVFWDVFEEIHLA